MLVIVPNALRDAIDRMLDEEIEKTPDAEKDRDTLKRELLWYFNEHGVLPRFTLRKKDPTS